MTISLVIDGSAKGEVIGAGLVVFLPDEESPLVESFHKNVYTTATSTLAEFFALQKALEWIQTVKPKEPVVIITDSMEVSTKTPRGQLPQNVLPLYHSLVSHFNIKVIQAKPSHEKMILLAHNASRAYITELKVSLPSAQNFKPKIIRSPFVWLCLTQIDLNYRVTDKDGEFLAEHYEAITALYEAVQAILKQNPHTIFYFDLAASQTIRHHSNHLHSNATTFLLSILERKNKRPLVLV